MYIEIKNIAKRFQKKEVLQDISFRAESGTCIGILGGNGCGKSTLLSILAGVQKGDSGKFLYNNKDLFQHSKQHEKLVGYVPQGTPLIEELTAWDNLLLWYDKEQLKQELEQGVLHMLGIHQFIHTTVFKMSGGMRKRLSIGCAISKKPPILLLDEPMAALDLACKYSITDYLRKYKAAGGILLLATHDVVELELCDEWYIIKGGRLVPFTYDGTIEKLVKELE